MDISNNWEKGVFIVVLASMNLTECHRMALPVDPIWQEEERPPDHLQFYRRVRDGQQIVFLQGSDISTKTAMKPRGVCGGGGTLIFSAYVGSDPASTIHPQKISGISITPKIYLKF